VLSAECNVTNIHSGGGQDFRLHFADGLAALATIRVGMQREIRLSKGVL
jgi:hypothetical protein